MNLTSSFLRTMVMGGVVAVLSAGPAAAGTVIFSDLVNPPQCSIGWTVSGPTSPPGEIELAQSFNTDGLGPTTVGCVEAAFGFIQNGTVQLGLYACDGAGCPGALIACLPHTAGSSSAFGLPATLTTYTAPPSTVLAGCTQYWVVASTCSNAFFEWDWNNCGTVGRDACSQTGPGGPWHSNGVVLLGAFQVNAAPAAGGAPEIDSDCATIPLALLAGAAIVAFDRRTRRSG
ncbi:MAG TPA: choice-of-anchor R domain-containing protein [Candidatus Xenobia bacterium]